MGGSVKAAGLGDGCIASQETIAKQRLTLPPRIGLHMYVCHSSTL